jgi:hypothetical protein
VPRVQPPPAREMGDVWLEGAGWWAEMVRCRLGWGVVLDGGFARS